MTVPDGKGTVVESRQQATWKRGGHVLKSENVSEWESGTCPSLRTKPSTRFQTFTTGHSTETETRYKPALG